MGKIIVSLLLIITLIFCISISGCTAMPSLTPSPYSGPVQSDESSPISSTQNVDIVRSGDTITASGASPYNTNTRKDPFLLKAGKATVTINLQGNGFGCSIGLNYKRPGSQSFDLIQLYVMDSNRTTQVSKTVTLPYTGDYYLAVNWADRWTVTIAQ
ncbi:MAG TPA: hypothetical protein VGK13_07735 [Methanocellaceae archaeon]